MKIIDDFLQKKDFEKIEKVLMGADFPWYYNEGIINAEDPDERGYQLTHTIFKDGVATSPAFTLIDPIFALLKPKEILRVKANLGPRDCQPEIGGWHTDFDLTDEVTTATFYINDNNGYTLFEDGKRVESKKNRFASFPCSTKHTGVSHTDVKVRVVLNLNYID